MRKPSLDMRRSLVAGALTIALLTACDKPAKVPERPPPVPAPEAAPAATAPAPATTQPATMVSISAAHPAATKVNDAGPAITAMRMATASSKIGVPVDLHYKFDGDVQTGRPVTLYLAAVPRVEGSNLVVSIKEAPGIVATAAPLAAQKASARTAYRQQLLLTKREGGPTELRVLVTMELPEGSAFGWFGVPLDGVPAVQSKQSGTLR
ncbi:MAG: hypothetical protein ABIQ86_09590 [Steroidobacteraceae bacterium]